MATTPRDRPTRPLTVEVNMALGKVAHAGPTSSTEHAELLLAARVLEGEVRAVRAELARVRDDTGPDCAACGADVLGADPACAMCSLMRGRA